MAKRFGMSDGMLTWVGAETLYHEHLLHYTMSDGMYREARHVAISESSVEDAPLTWVGAETKVRSELSYVEKSDGMLTWVGAETFLIVP